MVASFSRLYTVVLWICCIFIHVNIDEGPHTMDAEMLLLAGAMDGQRKLN